MKSNHLYVVSSVLTLSGSWAGNNIYLIKAVQFWDLVRHSLVGHLPSTYEKNGFQSFVWLERKRRERWGG